MKKLVFIFILVVVICTCFTVSVFAEFYVISVNNKCGPCKGTRSTGGRWCDNGDGTVTDMTTCLVWLKYADWGGTKPWRSGETDCSSPDYTCYDDAYTRVGFLASGETISTGIELNDSSVEGDWRLPTKTELYGIINEGNESVSFSNQQLFEGVPSSSIYYWSSTTKSSESSESDWAWIGTMEGGESPWVGMKTYDGFYVWPVRDGH
ncbi:MAG: DUF1566 domain-containing protein [Deltaproteobacteria bacterium]|nr:DUF1566 domain-containing protein [Deltaproteobacteria bacterium]MBW1849122.1 DUF1566 domain-containing protein [Deltaproteobacteria bacterium]MBW2364956.1 DUF1566 domain-containing protein [Deltaproteobacteria bacterium]